MKNVMHWMLLKWRPKNMIRYVVTISATQFATNYQSRMLKLIVS